MIREVNVSQLTDVVERLCIEANEHLPSDVKCAIEHCRACEDGEIAQGVLDNIIENYKIADAENVSICQAEILQKQLMKVYAEVMIKDIYENL